MNLTWGALALHLKGDDCQTMAARREKSAEAVVDEGFGERGPPQREGPNSEESKTTVKYVEAMHQMSNDQFEVPLATRGEAPTDQRSGEVCATVHESGRSGLADLMEQIVERGNLMRARKRVRANQGSAGVDGVTVDDLPDYLRARWPGIREQLLTGRYQPNAGRRVEIPKPGGGVRRLGIPTVLDRFIQQAVLQVLQPRIDPTFSEHSYGFRPDGARTRRCVRRNATCRVVGAGWWMSTWSSSLTESITTCSWAAWRNTVRMLGCSDSSVATPRSASWPRAW